MLRESRKLPVSRKLLTAGSAEVRTKSNPQRGESYSKLEGRSPKLPFLMDAVAAEEVRYWNRKWWGSQSAEYRAWLSMWIRCGSQRGYVKLGIKVCQRWGSYETFLSDVGWKPEPYKNFALIRIDKTGDYEPGNARWGTLDEQPKDKASSRTIEVDGKVIPVGQAARASGVPARVIIARLDRGVPAVDAIKPVKPLGVASDRGGVLDAALDCPPGQARVDMVKRLRVELFGTMEAIPPVPVLTEKYRRVKMPKLDTAITVKFSDAEREELAARAFAANLPLRTYIRRSMLAAGELSRETSLVLAEVRRVRELICRFRAVDEGGVEADRQQVEDWVDAIDERVLVGAVKGKG